MTSAAKSFIQSFAALAVFLLGIGTMRAVPYGTNLLANGNAEEGAASTTGAPVAVPKWTTTSAVTVVPYDAAGGFPTAAQGPPDGMNQFFAGGNGAATSTAIQDVDVSANAADIDTGHVAADLSAWLGGFADQDDQATLTAYFQSAPMATLSSVAIGPVTASDRGNVTQLSLRGNSVFLPVGTRIIHVLLTMTRKSNVGAFNDGYADDLSLILRGPGIVTTTADTGAGSLRDVLGKSAYVTFAPNVFGSGGPHQIVLNEPELPLIPGAMTIVGPGAKNLTIARYEGFSIATSPILIISAPPGTTAAVDVSGVTLTVGTQNNAAGPGITTDDNYGGILTVRDSMITGVRGHDGIAVGQRAILQATGCTFVEMGNGILSQKSTTIRNCTFSNNVNAIAALGQGPGGVTTVDSCTFYHNDNGIAFPEASPAPTVAVSNSIFAATELANFDNRFASEGTKVVSMGYNLSTVDDSIILKATGDRNSTDPKLSTLDNYGGPTLTHALLPGSPAVDKGNTMLNVDQRGLVRPIDDPNSANGGGNNSDIGAFELQAGEVITKPSPSPTPIAGGTSLANISTRLSVQTGDNALIGGFIITGTQPKKVIIRAIGPSLTLPGKLANPVLQLFSGSTLLESNDNWVDSPNRQAIIDSTIPPTNDLESAIVRTLPANGATYTAIVRGVNNTTGIGVVEAYDLDRTVDSKLANISTRGLVQTGDNVLIAGTIILGSQSQKVIVRAIGPSLPFAGTLANPSLELRDQNGAVLEANDNWVDSPNKQAIIDSTIPPTNDLESAIVRTLPGNGASYTAIVRGVNNTSGIAVVEVYSLQ